MTSRMKSYSGKTVVTTVVFCSVLLGDEQQRKQGEHRYVANKPFHTFKVETKPSIMNQEEVRII